MKRLTADRLPILCIPTHRVRDSRRRDSAQPGTRPAHHSLRHPAADNRRGMTLIEVLIATAMTLLIMLALAQGFKTMSDGVSAGRSRLTGSDQLRGISGLLRADLKGMTVNTTVLPQTSQFANGYFEYYDGPISDSTAMLFNYLPGATTAEEKLSASRWSDIDDVIMFTAKAKEGEWFRGRMPRALLKIHQWNLTGQQPNPAINATDWLTDVAIASEYAEIAWFMRPLNDVGSLDMSENAPYDTSNMRVNSVVDQVPVLDCRNADGSPGQDGLPDPDGMPDRVALCRRVLLIRPDLQITPPTQWPSIDASPLRDDLQFTARPANLNANSTDTFRYQMRFAHQRTDLSVRPVYDPVRAGFVLKTNTLSDLQLPENRFAHFVMPATTSFNVGNNIVDSGPAATLPLLALTPEVASPLNLHYRRMTNLAYGNIFQTTSTPRPAQLAYGDMQPFDRGFIPAAFFRTTITIDGNNNVVATPTLEEVVASNVVGFDIRGFDSSAQLLATPGADGGWGIANFDDDVDNPPVLDETNEAGWAGTDDLIVGPSDPGYALMLRKAEPPFSQALVVANSGAFVDLCWARRVANQIENFGMTHTLTGNDAGMTHFAKDWATVLSKQASIWSSALSGIEPIINNNPAVPLTSMGKAGRFSQANGIYQPVFDTFTDYYETDGNRQELGVSANGLVVYGGSASTNNPAPDRGANGFDDNLNGTVDESAESETSPPLAYKMPSVQIKLRIQDITAGTLQELSIVHDLTGNGN